MNLLYNNAYIWYSSLTPETNKQTGHKEIKSLFQQIFQSFAFEVIGHCDERLVELCM